jgi:hypothetical protein
MSDSRERELLEMNRRLIAINERYAAQMVR